MREKERGRESKRKRLGRILNESIFSISCKFLYSCQWPILGNCCCQSVLPIPHVHLWEHWVESIFRLLLDCLIFFHYCSFHTPSLPAPTYRGFFFFFFWIWKHALHSYLAVSRLWRETSLWWDVRCVLGCPAVTTGASVLCEDLGLGFDLWKTFFHLEGKSIS